MTSTYTRQSTFSNGDVIDAPLFNSEFDQLEETFDAVTGHVHDGSVGGGAPVPFIQKETSGVYVDTTTPAAPKILFKVGGVTLNTADDTYFTASGLVKHTPSGGSEGPLNTFLDGLTTSISDTLVAANQYTDDAVASFASGSGYVTDARTINGYDLSADRVLNAADVGALKAGDFGIGVSPSDSNSAVISDFNTATTSGSFFVNGTTANSPTGSTTERGTLLVQRESVAHASQIFIDRDLDQIWMRRLDNNVWSSWVEFYHTGNKPTAADVGAVAIGQFGIGATASNPAPAYGLDPRAITESGIYRVNTMSGAVNVPAGGNSGSSLIVTIYDTNDKQFLWLDRTGQVYRAYEYNGGWGGWNELYHTGNKPTAADVGALPLNQSFTYQNGEARWRTPDNVTIAGTLGSTNGLQVYQDGSGDALMTFHTNTNYAVHFGLDGSTDKLSVGGWSMGASSYAIYHEGNKPTAADVGAVDNSLLLNYNLEATAETTDTEGIRSYHITNSSGPDGNGTQLSQAYDYRYKTHLYHSWNNRIFARTQANNGTNNQEFVEVATQKTYVNAGTGVYSRLATNTHLLYYSGTNQTFSINDATYRIGDKIYVTKSIESAGEITVNFSASGSMVLPDNVSYPSVTLNAVGTVCIEKYFGDSWLVRRA